MTIKRPAAAVGAAVLLALSLSACGGAPTDASEEEFCDAWNSTDGEDVAPDDYEGQADAIHDAADELNEVGTPEGISDEEREGFEILVETAGDISADDIEEASGSDDPFAIFGDFSDEEQDKVEAFVTYAEETCSGGEESAPTE